MLDTIEILRKKRDFRQEQNFGQKSQFYQTSKLEKKYRKANFTTHRKIESFQYTVSLYIQ